MIQIINNKIIIKAKQEEENLFDFGAEAIEFLPNNNFEKHVGRPRESALDRAYFLNAVMINFSDGLFSSVIVYMLKDGSIRIQRGSETIPIATYLVTYTHDGLISSRSSLILNDKELYRLYEDEVQRAITEDNAKFAEKRKKK